MKKKTGVIYIYWTIHPSQNTLKSGIDFFREKLYLKEKYSSVCKALLLRESSGYFS